jgi:hypothetical protein
MQLLLTSEKKGLKRTEKDQATVLLKSIMFKS